MSGSELWGLARSGKLNHGDFVWQKNSNKKVLAGSIAGLLPPDAHQLDETTASTIPPAVVASRSEKNRSGEQRGHEEWGGAPETSTSADQTSKTNSATKSILASLLAMFSSARAVITKTLPKDPAPQMVSIRWTYLDEPSKRSAIRAYFSPRRMNAVTLVAMILAIGCTVGSILFLFCSLLTPIGSWLVSSSINAFLIATTGGTWWLYLRFDSTQRQTIPSDAQIDRWLQEDLRVFPSRAISKCDLNASPLAHAPLVVHVRIQSPVRITPQSDRLRRIGTLKYWMKKTNVDGVPPSDLLWRIGADDKLRSAVSHIYVILLSKDTISVYECDFNFLRKAVLNESTVEYHFRDVVSFSTFDRSDWNRGPQIASRGFRIQVTSGEPFSIRVVNEAGEAVSSSGIEQAIVALRTALRKRKGNCND